MVEGKGRRSSSSSSGSPLSFSLTSTARTGMQEFCFSNKHDSIRDPYSSVVVKKFVLIGKIKVVGGENTVTRQITTTWYYTTLIFIVKFILALKLHFEMSVPCLSHVCPLSVPCLSWISRVLYFKFYSKLEL